MARVLAESDCERCRPGLVSQPVNAASSLGYVVAGVDLWRRHPADRHFARAVVAVGLGSVALHGPGGRVGKWAHDASLLAMLGLLTASDVTVHDDRRLPDEVVGAVVAAACVAAHPRTTDAAQAVAGGLAAVAEARRFVRRTGPVEAAVTVPLWAVGASLHAFGRTGQPLCRPDSRLQAHAGWHLLSAAALWARGRFSP